MFQLVRFWSRRWIYQASTEVTGEMRHIQHILVVEAISTGQASGQATVATVAHQLGIDHSGASRMVSDATAAGYVSRTASQTDRRRASLTLTEQGHALLDGSRRWQRNTFDALTADWSDTDRAQFAGYLHRLARGLDLA